MKDKKKTYFVPFFVASKDGNHTIGNTTVVSEKRGIDLVQDVINKVTVNHRGAIILGIQEV